MTTKPLYLPRRTFCGGLAATAGLLATSPFSRAGAATYPDHKFNVVIPTGQGGGAERLARAFDDGWTPLLKQNFQYSFYPGAAGQIGYELFIKRRPHDGYNLLFGNMGPEMIMYVVQKPDYKFPDDYFYFAQVDADDSIIFARRDSPFKTAKQVVEAAKKRTLNVGVSRIPHPASISLLALGEATGSNYNLVPYGGGNPTYIGVMSGEVDIGALPISGVIALKEKFKVLGVFNRKENRYAALSENAPTINSVFHINLPDLYSARAWAVHADWAKKNPAHYELLAKTAKEAHASKQFRDAYRKTGAPDIALLYGDRDACTEYVNATVALAKKYEKILSAKRKGGRRKKKK
jgi:tripartite-type tricarboxylate transporter receptor subunit TctC